MFIFLIVNLKQVSTGFTLAGAKLQVPRLIRIVWDSFSRRIFSGKSFGEKQKTHGFRAPGSWSKSENHSSIIKMAIFQGS